MENAKNKPRPAAKSYGYANGKLTGWFLCHVAYINMSYRSKYYALYFLLTEIEMCKNLFFFSNYHFLEDYIITYDVPVEIQQIYCLFL